MLTTPNGHNPVILAKFKGNPKTSPSRKKILFYGHYDVIPAENDKGGWHTDPFSLEGIDGYLYGRGASDNKGPIMAAIYAVSELVSEQALESDITFLIEGEEECGSRGFAQTIREHKQKIGEIDWILVANSYWLDDHTPCLTYGLRGVIHATVEVESSHPDLHSGVDGSALLDESLKDLVVLVSKLLGKHGHVEIPNFYDPVLPLTKDEERLYEDITTTLLNRNPDLGDATSLSASLMRRWREASLTIHRFQTSGPKNSTIIPRLARVALSMRLVPNQETSVIAASLVDFLHTEFDKLDSKNALKVTIDHQAEPWLGDVRNEIFNCLEEAIIDVWGSQTTNQRRRSSAAASKLLANLSASGPPKSHRLDPVSSTSLNRNSSDALTRATPATSSTLANGSVTLPEVPDLNDDADPGQADDGYFAPPAPTTESRKVLYIREGGSIPAIRFLETEFDAPAAHLPCGQASDSAHLDNERLRLLNLYKSKSIFKKVFRDLPRR